MGRSKVLALIPARGGSKRIPRKNIQPFLGLPIISYPLEAVLKSTIFDTVFVSSDDTEIIELVESFGVKIPFLRSEINSSDFATTSDVIEEVLIEFRNRGIEFDYVCCIYPTAVFVTPDQLNESYEILKRGEYDSLTPVVKYSYPIQRAVFMDDGLVRWENPQFEFTRSQDLKEMYHDAGQFYWIKVKEFLRQKRLVMKKTYGFIMDESNVQDIDNLADWNIAEVKFAVQRSHN